MSLASEALFDGEPCAHAVAHYERERTRRTERQIPRLRPIERPVDCSDADAFPNIAAATEHLTALPRERRELLEREWRA